MATAANVVKFKRSAVPGKIPATTDLNLGEIALNTYDGRIYLKKSVASTESIVTLQQYSGGTGVAVSVDGVISIGQSVATTANVTFATGVFRDTSAGSNYTVKIGNATGSVFGIGTGSNSFGIANDALNNAQTGYVPYQVTATQVGFKTSANNYLWSFNADGTTQFPGYKLPAGDGTSGYVLQTNGAGTVTWVQQAAATTPYRLSNNGYTATLGSNGVLTVDNLTVNAQTNVTTQSFVVTSIGNLLLSENGQVLELPPNQAPITTENFNAVIIGANTGSWYFKSQGVLQLPPGGDITDSNGASVLGGGGGSAYSVNYTSQSLTTNQKAQARSNIDAASQDDAFVAAMILG